MKRRKFIARVGLGGTGVLASGQLASASNDVKPYTYPAINRLEDALTKEGLVNICLTFRAKESGTIATGDGTIEISRGQIDRVRHYLFSEQGSIDSSRYKFEVSRENIYVLAVWIQEPTLKTTIKINDKKGKMSFQLADIIEQDELILQVDDIECRVHFLLDKEIGFIDAQAFGSEDQKSSFRIAVHADPQGGDPKEAGNHPTRMKIHNAWIEETIEQANKCKPAFNIMLGDIVDSQGQERNFLQMAEFFKKLEAPILYAVGNHETEYKSVFGPGYNMSAFQNYFQAQKSINGLELMLYSFNMGDWHFIVWPDPLRTGFWESHPHYFDWLERDLLVHKDRPTIFLQHVPSHPIGIDPLIHYAESVAVKRTLLDILSIHGNVKYVFSGHVHIPIRASFKTAVSYRGMKMINLPAAGYRPRAFGEEEWHGGPTQGLLIIEIEGQECHPVFRTVTGETYPYPDQLPGFENDTYKLWLMQKHELPASETISNGSFKDGLTAWTPRFVYQEDSNPSNICKAVTIESKTVIHLFSQKRGYDVPGQDRLPQSINQISQAIELKSEKYPVLTFRYKIDQNSDLDGWCGAYIWLEGYTGKFKKMSLIYSCGKAFAGTSGKYDKSEFTKDHHFHLATNDKWQQAKLIPAVDFESSHNISYSSLQLDRLVISLGTWTINDAEQYPFGIYCSDFSLAYPDDLSNSSTVDGVAISQKQDNEIWWLGKYEPFTHTAGEHQYIMGTKKWKLER